jgi:hypothetical protein
MSLEIAQSVHPSHSETGGWGRPQLTLGWVPDLAPTFEVDLERIAPYKKLRSLVIIDQIPKSPSCKILQMDKIDMTRLKQAYDRG